MDRSLLLLRTGLLAVLGLALLDPRPFPGPRGERALEVLDVSASVGRDPAASLKGDALEAQDAWVAVADGHRWVVGPAPPQGLALGESLLGGALLDVAARLPGRTVLLTSDGRATDDAEAGARAVRAAGGRVHTRWPVRPAADLALLSARGWPVAGGAGAEVEALVASSVDAWLRVHLSRGSQRVASQELRLTAGARRRVRLTDPSAPSKPEPYRLRLEALAGTPDDDSGNDELALDIPSERTRVLWCGPGPVPRTSAAGPFLERLDGVEPERVQAADLVVLADLPYERIGDRGAEGLLSFVAGGGRLLVLGGPHAYAAGGYASTPLERALLPFQVARPEAGADWVVALDVSGSTSGPPLLALVSAVSQALPALRPGERLAVLPFAARAAAQPLPPGFVAAGAAEAGAILLRALAALSAGGPTDLAAGIAGALDLLAAGPARRERRLLLLTDGDPDDAPDRAALAALAPRLSALEVRFGALVIDMPRAVEALRATLARAPDDVRALSSSREAGEWLRASMGEQRAQAESERVGAPEGVEAVPGSWAGALFEGQVPASVNEVDLVPEALGLARARLRGGVARETPLAAERGVGAGRVAALAWGPAFEPDPASSLVRLEPLLARLASEADRGAPADLDDDEHVRVYLPAQAGSASLTLLSDGVAEPLLEVAAGLFRSESPYRGSGLLRVRGPAAGGAWERPLRLPARPPAEHRGAGPDRARLQAIALEGGGRLLEAGTLPAPASAGEGPSWAPVLLCAACILLVLERAATLRARRRSNVTRPGAP